MKRKQPVPNKIAGVLRKPGTLSCTRTVLDRNSSTFSAERYIRTLPYWCPFFRPPRTRSQHHRRNFTYGKQDVPSVPIFFSYSLSVIRQADQDVFTVICPRWLRPHVAVWTSRREKPPSICRPSSHDSGMFERLCLSSERADFPLPSSTSLRGMRRHRMSQVWGGFQNYTSFLGIECCVLRCWTKIPLVIALLSSCGMVLTATQCMS